MRPIIDYNGSTRERANVPIEIHNIENINPVHVPLHKILPEYKFFSNTQPSNLIVAKL